MKRKISALILMVVLISMLLSACGERISGTDSVILGTDLVRYNSGGYEGVEDFGFRVDMITKNKDVDVEFVSFSGENTQGLSVRLVDCTFDTIKNIRHNGYYIKLLEFVCRTGDERVKIESVKLKIDGEEKIASFPAPLEHFIREDDEMPLIQIRNCPVMISTGFYNINEYAFNYTAEADVTITKFGFNDFLDVKEAVISVNGEEKGSLENTLPLKVSKGSEISIRCKLAFKDTKTQTDCDNIYCDSKLWCIGDGDKETRVFSVSLDSQGVGNEDDAIKTIEIISGTKQKI